MPASLTSATSRAAREHRERELAAAAARCGSCSETGSRGDPVAIEQHARVARVLGEHELGLAQHAQRAQRHVLEVADRRRDEVEGRHPATPRCAARDRARAAPRATPRTTPRSVTSPLTSRAGVTSKAGFATALPGGSTLDLDELAGCACARGSAATSAASRSSIGIAAAVAERPVDRAVGQRDVERHAVVARGERLQVGADLVADVAVRRDAVGARETHVDAARAHQVAAGVVRDHGVRDAVLAELPRGEARALVARPRLVDPDVDRERRARARRRSARARCPSRPRRASPRCSA